MNLNKCKTINYFPRLAVLVLLLMTIFRVNVLGQTAEEQVLVTMGNWKKAVFDEDVDAILKFYSDDFHSRDASGKIELRGFWEEIIASGMLKKIEINLESAAVEISDNTAVFKIFNDEGELEMDFRLEKAGKESWLITSIPSEECSYEKYEQPYGDDCLIHDGYYRCWDIHIPEGLKKAAPLLIDIHGWQNSPAYQRAISGFEALADTEGFIVAWPYGLCESWNSGEQCCEPANIDRIDDVGFIRKMIAKISEENKIDSRRIYVTGLSNGCSMAQRLADEASDLIAAAACMSLHLLIPQAHNYSPISVMTLMGTKDDLYYPSEDMPGASENFETWKNMNNCTGTYEVTWKSGNSVAWTYTDCENGSEVTLVTIDGGGHVLYKGEDTEINTTKLAWDFLKRFSKK